MKKITGDNNPFTHGNLKWISYYVWFLKYKARQILPFVILGHFLPFSPPKTPKNQNFENMKKTPGDIIILQKCTINDNHIMYGSWDNFLSFWAIFCSFTPLRTQKIKVFKKWKKIPGDIMILHKCTKIMIICYTFPKIWCVTDVIFIFHLRLFFAPLPS